MKRRLATWIGATPLYPHWLEFRRLGELRRTMLSMLDGDVLEVGAGDGRLKREACSGNSRIRKYVATDYSTWDDAFEEGNQLAQSGSIVDQLHLREEREKLDQVCSALDLPFDDESFDWHVSSEVLEHIPDTARFFVEGARVLRKGGGMVLTAPFLYRIHPDESSDFFRVLPGGYAALAESHGLVVEKVFSNTGMGATCAALINQRMVRAFVEAPPRSIKRAVFLIMMPFVFVLGNVGGLLLDGREPDRRFATRFLVVMRKT